MQRVYSALRPLTLLCLVFLLVNCKEEPEEIPSQKEELNAWFEEKYEEELQMSPLQMTVIGRKDLYGELDDMSLEAQQRHLDWKAATVEELREKFNYENLDAADKTSYDLWVYQYEQELEGKPFWESDYVFHQMMGVHALFPNLMMNFHTVDSVSDMEAYISRLREGGRAMNQLIDRAEAQAEEGIIPPEFSFKIVLQQSKAVIDGQPFTDSDTPSPLWGDVNRKLAALSEAGLEEAMVDSLRASASDALVNDLQPAYENLIAWLESEMPNAEATPTGVSRHPNGEAYYNYRLKLSTTTDLTAEEIHEIGLAEVARIQGEMEAIKEKVGFEGTLKEFFEFVNTDEQFFFPNTDEGRQAYIDESSAYLDALYAKLPDYFGILPKAGLDVKRVEAFREQDGAPQHYYPGTPDGSRNGTYYAHLSDMTAMPKTTMEGVAYHEGVPGHHMQISIAQELESVPTFRTQAGFTAYSEGWGLYSETLAGEMGGYENPYYDFGRLVNEIWRAIRLVVDTGLHAKGWTEADGIRYFEENSSISSGAIKAEVQRYMVMPGQATAYKIGMLKIQELRQKAETELGDQFDIRGFHDTILGGGAMPLELLERRVNTWIDEVKAETPPMKEG
ncbi:Uncharacterized conserved protein, DUF885 familyt [Robiginitalea myxolifaciens]|uniref:Uncharacterized conserved protein, DUF885 familyt n=1 Tax=Robiginitalea myxolifaciens TaxID=400055 RepID=A0A1I6FSP4_9FLAO|nr:DUF885 domain-containing protein [Robiginitalea myxolifaciens]SFR32965.1 Uncharacterized conserved protein, DUF885 familyt [Robiginitalea myxolifaciens]